MYKYLLENSSDFTEQEAEDYIKGSSKFYSEGATIVCNLDELYGLDKYKEEGIENEK